MPTSGSDRAFIEALETGKSSTRLLSLDAFRGLTILAMIMVNNPGRWGEEYQYWPLAHARWHGWTPTDLIFPFFLFIVGTSLAYSLRKYRNNSDVGDLAETKSVAIDSAVYWRIVRRTALLILLGWLPSLLLKTIAYVSGSADSLELDTLRLPGVLVRIALVYCATSLIVLHIGLRGQVMVAAVLLLGYWALLAWLPNPNDYQANLSPQGNVVRLVDLKLIGPDHMYTRAQSERTDPEGLVSTLPAIVTALLGYWTGSFIQRGGLDFRTVGILLVVGALCAGIGLAWDLVFPINKKIWTSSFVVLTAGLAMIALAACLILFDFWGWRRLSRPFEIVGLNAIFVFVASGLLSIALNRIHIGEQTAHDWIYLQLFASWLSDPRLASLGYSLLNVGFWWLVLWGMARRGWTIRV